MGSVSLTERYEDALKYAFQLHRCQVRKGSGIPYVSHLLAVSALVMQDGGDEDQAIAGLLHDAVEDQGGQKTLDEIQRKFGERVAEIVLGCSDTLESPKPPWRERKEKYLAHLESASVEVRRVSQADKLHNASSILQDLHREGTGVWGRFKGGKEGTLWYFDELLRIFRKVQPSPLVAELGLLVEEIKTFDSKYH
jgi:(p)ppGpp synthase/HD superfamily hydrolase